MFIYFRGWTHQVFRQQVAGALSARRESTLHILYCTTQGRVELPRVSGTKLFGGGPAVGPGLFRGGGRTPLTRPWYYLGSGQVLSFKNFTWHHFTNEKNTTHWTPTQHGYLSSLIKRNHNAIACIFSITDELAYWQLPTAKVGSPLAYFFLVEIQKFEVIIDLWQINNMNSYLNMNSP